MPSLEQVAMVSKAYTDGISLWKDGPQITRDFRTESRLSNEKSYKTVGCFVSKMVPKLFVTTLTVADELTYYESVTFERRTVLKSYSETTNVFIPKEMSTVYVSKLRFDPDVASKYYTVGIELLPGKKVVVAEMQESNGVVGEEQGDARHCGEKSEMNGDVVCRPEMTNGDVQVCDS